jgi:ketosteroid isomerase-like protein
MISAAMQKPADEQQVLEVNDAFYQAMQSLDLAGMEDVWWHEDWVCCLHPGWELLSGWEKIKESWVSIFHATGQLRVSVREPLVSVIGDAAWVICIEQLTSLLETDFTTARVQTTNIFVRRKREWRMVHHHTTPLPDRVMAGITHSVQ